MKKAFLTMFAVYLSIQFSYAQNMRVGTPKPNLQFAAENSQLPISGTLEFENLNRITGSFKLEISGTKKGKSPVYLGIAGNGFTVKADNASDKGADRNKINPDETLSFTISDITVQPKKQGNAPNLVIKSIRVSTFAGLSMDILVNGNVYETWTDNTGKNTAQDLTFAAPVPFANGTKITIANPSRNSKDGFRVLGFTIGNSQK